MPTLKEYLDNFWKYQKLREPQRPAEWYLPDNKFLWREPPSPTPKPSVIGRPK